MRTEYLGVKTESWWSGGVKTESRGEGMPHRALLELRADGVLNELGEMKIKRWAAGGHFEG